MNLTTQEGYTMIDTKDKVRFLHRITIDGPYTKDSSEHHEWEDSEHRRLLSMEGYSFLRKWAKVSAWIVAACFVLSFVSAHFNELLSLIDFSHVYVRPQ